MICPKCSILIEDESLLTCPECNEQIAVNAQKEKISAAYETSKGIVKKRVQSSSFLATTIFMTILLVMHAAAIAATAGAGILFWLLPCIFAGIAISAGYKLYSQKNEVNVTEKLEKFSRYDVCSKVYCSIMAIVGIIAGIVGAAVSLVIPFAKWFFDDTNNTELLDPSNGFDTTTGVIAILGAAVVVVVFLLFKAVFADRSRAYSNVVTASSTGEYVPVAKSTFSLSYVVAGFIIFFGVVFMASPAIVSIIITTLPPMIAKLFGIVVAAGLTVGLSFICLGVYMILSAKWLADTQSELLTNNAVIAYELNELERIYDAVRDQQFQKDKEEKEAIKAAAIAKEEARLAYERDRLDNEYAARAEMRAFFAELKTEEDKNKAEFWAAIQAMKEEEQKKNAEFLDLIKVMKEEEQKKNAELLETIKAMKEEEKNANIEFFNNVQAMKEDEKNANVTFWDTFKMMVEEDQKVKADLVEKYGIVEEQMKFLQQVVMQQMIGANISNNNNNNNSNGNQNPTIITTTPLVNPYVVPQVAPAAPVYTAPAPQQYAPAQAPANNPNGNV